MASIKLKGDTSGELTIQAPSVAGTNTLNLQASSGTLATTAQASIGTKNLIINGNMQIAQRGTSATGISSGGTYHTIDRFVTVLASAGTWTQTQDNDVPTGQGFAKSLKMQCTTANASLASGAYNSIQHFIEAQNLQHLKYGTSSAESLTVSFWVKSNKTGTYVVQFLQDDSVGLRTIVKSYTISNADTWEKKTITIEGDTAGVINNDNGSGLQVRFGLAFGSAFTSGTLQTSWSPLVNANFAVGQVNLADSTSNYINITGVQLEVGTEATPFENRMYSTELAMCQRYFVNALSGTNDAYGVFGMGQNNTATEIRALFTTPVQMRTLPSFNYSGSFQAHGGAGTKDITSFASTVRTGNNFLEILAGTASGGSGGLVYMLRRKNDSSAYFHLDAEL